MSRRRLAAFAALGGAVVLAGWVAARLAGFASLDIGNSQARIEDNRSAFVSATALPDRRPMTLPETPPVQVATPPVQVASASTPDPVPNDAKAAVTPVETPNECLVAQICIDEYLWAAYQRAPKVDTIGVPEQIKVTVKKKGKTRAATKTVTKLVDEDFAWKDSKAADKAGMSLMDYVIGGMDASFRTKLYHALRALDDAGLVPGITSGFRDDYRQSLASGRKAATDRSYHGGSFRGGYGHGLAADLVSVKGETRFERIKSSESLWKWVDAHGKEFGVGRPYLDFDPPHVGPIDGKEYADKRGLGKIHVAKLETKKPVATSEIKKAHLAKLETKKTQVARLETKKRHRPGGHDDHGVSKHDDHGTPKRARTASSRVRSI